MKKYLMLPLLLFVSASVLALEITEADLAGQWLIVKMGDMDVSGDEDTDIWQFEDGEWTAISGGRALPSDSFQIIDGDTIDLGYSKIKVVEFNGSIMKTDQMGFEYTLEKQ